MQSIKPSDTQQGLERNTSNWAGAAAMAFNAVTVVYMLGIHLCDLGKFRTL